MIRILPTILIILFAGLTASAQFEKLIQPSDLKQKTIVTEPPTLNKGFFRAEAGVSYIVQDKYFSTSGEKKYYPVSMWGASYRYTFGLRYGITDRLEIDAYLSLINNSQKSYFTLTYPVINSDMSLSADLKGLGIGDTYLLLKYQVIPEKERRISITLYGDVTLPTGQKNPHDIKDVTNYKLPTGFGYYSTGLTVLARKVIYPYSITTQLNYTYNFKGSKIMDVEANIPTKFKKGNMFMAGGSFNFHLNDWIALANELYYFHWGSGEEENGVTIKTDPAWVIKYLPRLVFQIRRYRIEQIVDVPLAGNSISADPGYIMKVQFTF